MPIIHVGIDPGAKGGIASLCGTHVEYWPLPADDWPALHKLLTNEVFCWEATYNCTIELIHSRPGQSSVAMFSFGKSYGALVGLVMAQGVQPKYAQPKAWQKRMGVHSKNKEASKGVHKRALRAHAKRMFPSLDVWRGLKKDQDAVCDALLLAEYSRRRWKGEL